jgi:uncharacterized protein (TIGR03435 family)
MKHVFQRAVLAACAVPLIFGQSDSRLTFAAAAIRASAQSSNPRLRKAVHDGLYEVRNATMLDLVVAAYGFDYDKVVGGPSWLEVDHFDIIAKLPGETTPDDRNLMLQALLEDRFKLVAHKVTRPMKAYALSAGPEPRLKKASGSGPAGCAAQDSPGPGGVHTYNPDVLDSSICRNLTMEAFAAVLSRVTMMPVEDRTGLAGNWNFDVRFPQLIGGQPVPNSAGEKVTVADALDKQLGLKLEEVQVPTPVITIANVNEKPAPDPADAALLPPPPTVFDVASVKPTDPSATAVRFGTEPGGRVSIEGFAMRGLLLYAFRDILGTENALQQITGIPNWADSARFDITAKTPPDTALLDTGNIGPPLRALLADRFKMAYHMGEQPGKGYSLEASKPKMTKADPDSRTSCRANVVPSGAPRVMQFVCTCQNATMARFVDWLNGQGTGLDGPVADATGLEGGWDFDLRFNWGRPALETAAAGGDAARPGTEAPTAAEPTGGYDIFEALEKELGLKLVAGKYKNRVVIIDHLEEKPTEAQ